MASLRDAVLSLLPYHLLFYGTFLGAQLYQSFINTKLCFRHLPLPQFTQLQKRVFPVYFKGQVGLVLLTAATHPPSSLLSLVEDVYSLVPLTIILVVDTLNCLVSGPQTIRIMTERTHQETIDGKSYRDEHGMSSEMKRLNRQFSRSHAMTIHLNAISLVATIFYGFRLASRFNI